MFQPSEYLEVLSNYESSQLIRKQFEIHHGRALNNGKAEEIAASFTQARGYLESASTAPKNIRPLLVYYAVLSFSRGLTLYLSRELREAGLAPSHGLTVDGWGEELARGVGSVAALTIKFNENGTLPQLVEATNHESYLRNNSSSPNLIQIVNRPRSGSVVTLGDLLARLPEVRASYVRWRDDRCQVSIWPQKKLADGSMEIRVDYPYASADWEAVFGMDVPYKEEGKIIKAVLPANFSLPSLSDATGNWDIGTLIAMTPYPTGVELSKISTAFLVSYALGMLVRYYPSHWMGILQNKRHNAALPTLLAALQYVEMGYPRLIVEFLERRPN